MRPGRRRAALAGAFELVRGIQLPAAHTSFQCDVDVRVQQLLARPQRAQRTKHLNAARGRVRRTHVRRTAVIEQCAERVAAGAVGDHILRLCAHVVQVVAHQVPLHFALQQLQQRLLLRAPVATAVCNNASQLPLGSGVNILQQRRQILRNPGGQLCALLPLRIAPERHHSTNVRVARNEIPCCRRRRRRRRCGTGRVFALTDQCQDDAVGEPHALVRATPTLSAGVN